MSGLYIHIGAKKTGSTTLQSFIKQNPGYMKANGVFVSPALGTTEDKFLSRLYMERAGQDALKRAQMFFCECADFFRRGGRTAMISAESFSDLKLEEVKLLKRDLDNYFERYRIFLYIRRQDLVAVSHYSTLLKGGGVSKKLMSTGLGVRGRRGLSYGSILKDWGEVFSRESVVVRKYVEKWQRPWDIVDDFLLQIGITAPRPRVGSGNRNLPLSGEAAAYLRKYNELAKLERVRLSPMARRRLVNALQALPSEEKIPRPSRRSAVRFLRSFDKDNEIVRSLYFPNDRTLFDDNVHMYPEEATDIDSLLSLDFAMRLNDYLLRDFNLSS